MTGQNTVWVTNFPQGPSRSTAPTKELDVTLFHTRPVAILPTASLVLDTAGQLGRH